MTAHSKAALLGVGLGLVFLAACVPDDRPSASWEDASSIDVHGFSRVPCLQADREDEEFCLEASTDETVAAAQEVVGELAAVGVVFEHSPECRPVADLVACESTGSVKEGTILVAVVPRLSDSGTFAALDVTVLLRPGE